MKKQKIILCITIGILLLCLAGFDPIGNSLKTIRVMIEDSRVFMIFKNESGQ